MSQNRQQMIEEQIYSILDNNELANDSHEKNVQKQEHLSDDNNSTVFSKILKQPEKCRGSQSTGRVYHNNPAGLEADHENYMRSGMQYN
jgi:hypothetical protein